MTNFVQTALLCDKIRKADGRGDPTKQRLMRCIRQALDREDAIKAVRLNLTYDWRRTDMRYYGADFDLLEIDYGQIVDTFWKMWRRNSKQFDLTYVRYTVKVDAMNHKDGFFPHWTFMNIFVGDSYDHMYRGSTTPRYPYTQSDVWSFEADKKVVFEWIRRYQNLESLDLQITVKICGMYGNYLRHPYNNFFDYENAYQ